MIAAGRPGGNQQTMDYLALSRMFATAIGANMMQFSQAAAPQGGSVELTVGKTVLATGKGFDQDQIAKLKDACGIRNAQQIPAVWLVIQATNGKSIDTYRMHIAKAINSWCRSHHINRDKAIFLKAEFFEDLVALCFNPGGPVAQFHSVARGKLMLACRSLTAVEAKEAQEYEEAAAATKQTRAARPRPQLQCTWTSSSILELTVACYGRYLGITVTITRSS
jgi:hypothetical protein